MEMCGKGSSEAPKEFFFMIFWEQENSQSLNNRQLTSVSSDRNDLKASTPNHFLLGQSAISFPALDFEQNFNQQKRYARAQSYANAIWTRWRREYVPMLNQGAK